MPHEYKFFHGYHFPWDIPTMATAGGSGAILASLVTIQPLWLILLVGIGVEMLLGVFASRRLRTFSFRVVEDRALTNVAILGLSKFFYFLQDNAQHMHQGPSIGDAYPFADWVAWSCLLLIVRSMIAYMAILGVKIPWMTEWLDKLSAKPPHMAKPENPARDGSMLEP